MGRKPGTVPPEFAELIPDDQRLLASCFDNYHSVGGGLFAIGSEVERIDHLSSTGMDYSDGKLYRCLWSTDGNPAELVAYDHIGVLNYRRLDNISMPHDVMSIDGRILIAATIQNQVQWIAADGSVVRCWTAPGEVDSWHLNSLATFDGGIAVCAFGRYEHRRGWQAAGKPANGCVIDLESGRQLLGGLHAPHNPYFLGTSWLVCNSAAGEIIEVGHATGEVLRRQSLPGWPRGLLVTERHLFVGLSADRHAAGSKGTASVVAIDRETLRPIARADCPAREIYALSMVPETLLDGLRRGFATNATRVHEQGQWAMFDGLGIEPRRLWAVGELVSPEEQGVHIVVDAPPVNPFPAGVLLSLHCTITNIGTAILTPAPPHPTKIIHRWYDANGDIVPTEEITAALGASLPPGSMLTVPVRARAPRNPGCYRLRITAAQDGGQSFDETGRSNYLDLDVTICGNNTRGTDSTPRAATNGCYSETRSSTVKSVHNVTESVLEPTFFAGPADRSRAAAPRPDTVES